MPPALPLSPLRQSSTWKNITPRREHRERAQPNYRSNMGLLEKHKDYVVRAKDYHSKQDRLKTLKRKAEERNPDEFYFKMNKTKTKVGRRGGARTCAWGMWGVGGGGGRRWLCCTTVVNQRCLGARCACVRLCIQEGIHTVTHSDTMTADLLKVLRTQDAGYVQTKLSSEEQVG